MPKILFWPLLFLILFFEDIEPVWAQSQAEGKKLYGAYCSSCQSDNAKGDGPASKSLPVKLGDHTDGSFMNQLPDKLLVDIISKGGNSVGKSAIMPAWENQLSEKQIRDIIAYIRNIADPAFRPSEK